MPSRLNRRHFLTGSASLAAAGLWRPVRAQGSSSKRLRIAVIGALGKGQSDTRNVAFQHDIVALVDVDAGRLDQAARRLAKGYEEKSITAKAPKLYSDFRKMFDEMADGIDAVIVATPDHSHFPAAMWAVRNKKHICVQKPLCNTIDEVRRLHRAARVAGVVTQMGNQGRTMEGQRQVKEWIEQDGIGKLQEIRLWTNRPIWPQGPLTKKPVTCPEGLDWNAWLAQEAEEPYFQFETPEGVSARRGNSVHPFNWRGWWQYGCGALGDMGCHIMDATFNVLGRRIPSRIEAESGSITELQAPLWSTLTYHFAATDRFPALRVTWHDGSRDGRPNKPARDPRVPAEAFDKASSGMLFIGTEGVVYEGDAYCARPQVYPEERFADVKQSMESGRIRKTEPRSPHPGNPQLEWAQCIVDGGTPSSSFDYAAPLTEFVLLGNLAVRAGQPVEWDAKRGRVSNAAEANRFVKRAGYRKGWV